MARPLTAAISLVSVRDDARAQQRIRDEQNDSAMLAARGAGAGTVGGTTDAVPEGATNLYFTNERAQDAIAALLVAGSNITLTYSDAANTLTISATAGGTAGITRVILNPVGHSTIGAVALTDYAVNAHAGFTQTLPTAVGNTNRYTIKNIDASGTVSIATTGGQTIEGTASPITIQPGQSLDLISDGANWNLY